MARLKRLAALAAAGVALPAAAAAVRAATNGHRPGHPYLAGAPLLIPHRGGSALAPENTLLAFRRAVEWWRADILELDVSPTRDGEAVVLHDLTLQRTTDGRGAVADRSLDEVRELDAGYRFTPDVGRTFPFRGRGVTVPTLHEVLTAFPDVRVNVEIKDGRVQHRVWEVVHELDASHRVLVASGKLRNRTLFDVYGGARSASAEEMYLFLALHTIHATRLYYPVVDAFQMPEENRGRRVLNPRFVREVHAKNLAVHVWTVNEEADMRRLLGWGVDGLITDRPDTLARVLNDVVGRPLPPGPPADEAEPFMERLLRGGWPVPAA
jgi:glycerophosphoryl diester phosphodiesterase